MAADKLQIEDLPLVTREELASDEHKKKTLVTGMYVDAKDTASKWCVARALKVANGEVAIQYDGWGIKYNEVHSFIIP